METEIIESFNCPICLEICEDPVESSCCKNLFCYKCSEQLKECSFCRKKCDFERSVLAKRLIDRIPASCEHCKQKSSRGNLKAHYLNCEDVPVECSINNCEVGKIARKNMIEHIFTCHRNDLSKKLDSILNTLSNQEETRVFNASPIFNRNASLPLMNAGANNSLTATNNVVEKTANIDRQRNSRGYSARLGESGKYYCEQQLDGPRCTCCNGYCGPTNGCNCSSCMQLDLNARSLPRGWLVNCEGFAARKGESGLFYCGRLVLQGVRFCDGYCGPTDGPNCNACKRLDMMASMGGRYRHLI